MDGARSAGIGAGIGVTERRYEQAAIATILQPSDCPIADVSTELHQEAGSVTTVPPPEPARLEPDLGRPDGRDRRSDAARCRRFRRCA